MKWSMFMSTHKNDDSTPKHAIGKLGNNNPIQLKTTLSLLITNRKTSYSVKPSIQVYKKKSIVHSKECPLPSYSAGC